MNTSMALDSMSNSIAQQRAKPKRPKVRFLTPAQLAPFKEDVWAVNAALVDWSRADFEAAFDRTDLYAVFFAGGKVVGLATVMEHEFEVDGRRIFTIGLGRAVVLPEYRNHFLVQRALIFRWMRKFSRRPLQPIYIWGACVTYKSYLSFVRVLKVVYPAVARETPSRDVRVLDAIGKHWYGAHYLPDCKAVTISGVRIADNYSLPKPEDMRDPDIRFYCASVPQIEGVTTGLLTISPCIRSNFLPMVTSWVRNFVRKSLGMQKRR
jgi:hypothetical protein